ncbi:MAG: glycosyltransferase family 4 protein [Gammaproteobacteria bacterium]|nr:glycosyltransferase family 4 protein [Gammaproteobacteria bacterium]
MRLPVLSFLLVFPLSVFLTWAILGYVSRRNMLDVPGERSLHSVPTPRGGGLAIAICILGGAAILAAMGEIPRSLALSMIAGGAVVATLGWIEDRAGLAPAIRGMGYLCAAALSVWLLGGLERIEIGTGNLELGWAGFPLAVLGLAWLTNLYNFMDGADGIAAAQGITAGGFAAVLFGGAGQGGAAALCAIIAAACAGFLVFNRPPARLFMGDVGSCLLGYSFGVLAVFGEHSGAVPLPAWLLLLLVFAVDASLTLVRRLLRGERWYSPHRSHAYQLLVRSGLGHRGLLAGFLAVNALILGPLVLLAASRGALPAAALSATLVAVIAWFGIQRRHGWN